MMQHEEKQWLTTALTIAVRSAQIVSPWTGQQHACRTDISNVHSHVVYIPYEALSMLAPLTIVPSLVNNAAPTGNLE